MKRFYNRPSNAQRKFTRYAMRIHRINLKGAPMRGGFRL